MSYFVNHQNYFHKFTIGGIVLLIVSVIGSGSTIRSIERMQLWITQSLTSGSNTS
jgi:hypothetical protein